MGGISTKILGQGILKQCHFADALFNHKDKVACKQFIILLQERASSASLFFSVFFYSFFYFFKGIAAHPGLTFQFFLCCPY